jgi:cyclophilin family peptidyl-prolyl cis-trans isomerase
VQVIGELASYEPENDAAKKIKDEAPEQLRKLVLAFINADPTKEPEATMAAPDALQAFARFKTDDLGEILRTALKNPDIQIRATSAGLIADLPPNDENVDAVNDAFDLGWKNDLQSNDAILATMDALFKLDKAGKRASVTAFILAASSPDQLVREKAMSILKDESYKNKAELQSWLASDAAKNFSVVTRYAGKGTKVGQVLNTDADYRRALSRKNGTVSAIFTTQKGKFTIDFLPQDAPLTVDNFIKLARAGYFNGLEVHRVVPNFVMQDGDPRGDGNGGPGWTIRCEVNMVPYERGAVGMALSGKDTGGSQWFVTHSPQQHLDGGYTVFGKVNEKGMKVVDNIVRGDKIISVRVIGK